VKRIHVISICVSHNLELIGRYICMINRYWIVKGIKVNLFTLITYKFILDNTVRLLWHGPYYVGFNEADDYIDLYWYVALPFCNMVVCHHTSQYYRLTLWSIVARGMWFTRLELNTTKDIHITKNMTYVYRD